MALLDYLRALRNDPAEALFLLLQRAAPGYLVRRLAGLGGTAGLKQPRFLLSFDCDTENDLEVVESVHARLAEIGITPVYAVPGELLEAGADIWRRIHASGAEFINHGWRRHTEYRDGRYVSTVFYDQLGHAAVAEDIRAGHETVHAVLGVTPTGFRTPHFGTFQSKADLTFLHDVLNGMGYRFSTSTVPYWGLRHGPVARRGNLRELPVTGCRDFPMTILDSYTFRFTGGRFTPNDYPAQIERWAEVLSSGQPIFLNLYADPSQVADWPEFFRSMSRLAPFVVHSYDSLLREIGA